MPTHITNHPLSNQETELKLAFRLSIPTLFAYFPLGMVFGILFAHSGFAWFLGPIMSLLVYGGSVQFVALSMMTEHADVMAIVFATLFIAFRNSFYGLSLLSRFNQRGLLKIFLIFTLVDATYVTLISNTPKEGLNDSKFCILLSLLIYSYWVIGTCIGAIFSNWLPPFSGLAFILPCFFMVLTIEYFLAKRKWHTIIIPILTTIVASLIMLKQYLLITIILSMLSILAIHYFIEEK